MSDLKQTLVRLDKKGVRLRFFYRSVFRLFFSVSQNVLKSDGKNIPLFQLIVGEFYTIDLSTLQSPVG